MFKERNTVIGGYHLGHKFLSFRTLPLRYCCSILRKKLVNSWICAICISQTKSKNRSQWRRQYFTWTRLSAAA